MSETDDTFLYTDPQGEWVRLRTLVLLRWLAVLGQTLAIAYCAYVLRLQIDVGLCALAIGAAIISNLIATFVHPENKRLREDEVMLTMLFDLAQLSFLLYLTGGLNNPFTLLLLVPVVISATTMRLGPALLILLVTICSVSVLALWHEPLRNEQGFILRMPWLLLTGFWIALVIGAVFLGAYARRITMEMQTMSQALLATQLALSREQNLSNLGGVIAAAAHELGTPLATIKLTSTELLDEFEDRPDLREDLELIRDQADRCRKIMRSMGRAGKDDLHMRHAPLGEIIRDAAEPHANRGIDVVFDISPEPGEDWSQPVVHRRPEIIHGLRNLVQNAVDFARSQVWVEARWNQEQVIVRVTDNGRGYPVDLLGRIGDPFLRHGKTSADRQLRPEYQGMGLGLFIAKSLLERSGARITFANGTDPFLADAERPMRSGAVVEVVWPREAIALAEDAINAPLGENVRIEV